ncbi:hypothetical protein MTR_3g033580 [Medicago truncatula]|uniref:Uncharacterized protein n=1 Tax=Medicago truncatula TaxID=3880 RepID=G7IX35_MEDTR|nr:hypothetical protein MTR_3g033580 [Medicago truncatula]
MAPSVGNGKTNLDHTHKPKNLPVIPDSIVGLQNLFIHLVVANFIEEDEEEEQTTIDEKDGDPTDQWKEKRFPGKCRNDLVSSLQVLGDYQSLLTPPQSIIAAAKAMLFISGIAIGSAYYDCLTMAEMPVDCCK